MESESSGKEERVEEADEVRRIQSGISRIQIDEREENRVRVLETTYLQLFQ